MEKIKVTGRLIELSEDDQLLTVDMEAIVRVQRIYLYNLRKTGCEISLLGGDVINVDQDYEDIVKAWEDYYAED